MPAGGELLSFGRENELKVARNRGTLHESMLASVEVQATMASSAEKRRKTSEASSQENPGPSTSKYDLLSPVLAGKAAAQRETCLENVAPFWALLRAPAPSVTPNMALDVLHLKDLGVEATESPKGFKVPKHMATVVEVPVAVNSTNIEKGEMLTLPWEITNVGTMNSAHEVSKSEARGS